MGQVLFLHMPLAVPTVPSLAAELLSRSLIQQGLRADVFYGTCRLRRTPLIDAYIHSISGSIMFTPQYYHDRTPESIARHLMDCPKAVSELYGNYRRFGDAGRDAEHWPVPRRAVTGDWPFGTPCDDLLADVLTHMDVAALCIDRCLADIPPGQYDIYLFSLMFDAQKLPSLALARRLKQREPSCRIVFGGTACDGDMGLEIIERFPCVDVVARGEADVTIGALVRALRGQRPLAAVPGLVLRSQRRVIDTGPAPRLESLDTLPTPDYTSFLDQLGDSDWKDEEPFILYEASRGCWWGEKHHCKFCGLRADGMTYRRKSARRIVTELQVLGAAYPRHRALYATDAILDHAALRHWMPLLPALARDHGWKLFFELKSNLRREEVALLAEAGVSTVQPGIESFSDRILQLMDKGNRGLAHVQLLKWLAAYRISVIYNLILGTPGEVPRDYEETLEMTAYLWHLPPPTSLNVVSLDRFSPYLREPARYGLADVAADAVYGPIFPDPAVALSRIAYKFQYRSRELESPELQHVRGELELAVQSWHEEHAARRLEMIDRGDVVRIVDEWRGVRKVSELRGAAAILYRYCDAVRSWAAIRRAFPHLAERALRFCLERWVANRWMYRSRGDEYLALAVDVCPPPSGLQGRSPADIEEPAGAIDGIPAIPLPLITSESVAGGTRP